MEAAAFLTTANTVDSATRKYTFSRTFFHQALEFLEGSYFLLSGGNDVV